MFNPWEIIDNLFPAVGKSSKKLGQQAALDQEMLNLRARNQHRIDKIKADMGEKYILHPSHTKSRLDTPRPV